MPDIVRHVKCLPQSLQQLKASAAVGKMGDRRCRIRDVRHLNRDAALLCQPAANLFQCRVLHGAWPLFIKHPSQLAHKEALEAVLRRLGALNVSGKPAQQQIGISHIDPHQLTGIVLIRLRGDKSPAAAVQFQHKVDIRTVNLLR